MLRAGNFFRLLLSLLGTTCSTLGPAGFQENSLSGVFMPPNKGSPTFGARNILSKKGDSASELCYWSQTSPVFHGHIPNASVKKMSETMTHNSPNSFTSQCVAETATCPAMSTLALLHTTQSTAYSWLANHPKFPASSAARCGHMTVHSHEMQAGGMSAITGATPQDWTLSLQYSLLFLPTLLRHYWQIKIVYI